MLVGLGGGEERETHAPREGWANSERSEGKGVRFTQNERWSKRKRWRHRETGRQKQKDIYTPMCAHIQRRDTIMQEHRDRGQTESQDHLLRWQKTAWCFRSRASVGRRVQM